MTLTLTLTLMFEVCKLVFKVFYFSVLAKSFVGKFGELKNILTGITGADLSLFWEASKLFLRSKGFVHQLEKDLTTDLITMPQDSGIIGISFNATSNTAIRET